MRLSDAVSSMGLAFWPQLGLLIFMLVFVAVAIRVFSRPRGAYDRQLRLPLEDGPAPAPRQGPRHG